MPLLEIRNIETYYGPIMAIKGVSLDVEEADIVTILGANGAGKTTVLRTLSTVLQPTAGQAWIMGHEVREAPERVRSKLGFYSASTALYPKISPRETLRFFAKVNRYPRKQVTERVEELVHRFGLEEYADTRVEKLSSGMKQKVSIARTVAHDPPVLVFDEPTVGLDVMNALEMVKVIREMRDAGKTILFSSHIMSEVEKLCDRIAIIHRGMLLALGTLDELREQTGEHYLEDVFVRFVTRAEGVEGAVMGFGGALEGAS